MITPERLAEIGRFVAEGETTVFPGGAVRMLRELLDHIAQLEAQRGGEVVVPADGPTAKAFCLSVWAAIEYTGKCDLEQVFAFHQIKTIPADRVLADGSAGPHHQVQVRDSQDVLEHLAGTRECLMLNKFGKMHKDCREEG